MNAFKIDGNIVDTYLDTLTRVFSTLFLTDLNRGGMSFWGDPFKDNEVAIITGVLGDHYEGTVVYSMSEETARQLVDKLDMGEEMSSYGEVLFDVLGEWMNIISGNVTQSMKEIGISLYITPPTVVLGDQFSMQLVQQVPLFVQMDSDMGMISVNFAIKNVVQKDIIVNV